MPYPAPIRTVGTLAATGGTSEIAQANDWASHLFYFVATGGAWKAVVQSSPDGGTSWCDVSAEIDIADGARGGCLRVWDIHPNLRVLGTRTAGSLAVYVSQSVPAIEYRG